MNVKKIASILGLLLALLSIYQGIVQVIDQRNEITRLKGEVNNLKMLYDDLRDKNGRLFSLVTKNAIDGSVTIEKLSPFLTPVEISQVSVEMKKVQRFPFSLGTFFSPSGWMGDGTLGNKYIKYQITPAQIDSQQSVAIKISYQPGPKGFAGIYWQFPDGNWGQQKGRNLAGAHAITFIAKGENGGEIVEFKSGGMSGRYPDSYQVSLGNVTLKREWSRYRIDLSNADLSNVIGAFAWIVAADENGNRNVTTYIANLQVE